MGQNDGRDDERPAHHVTVSPFRMARCQVTNADYAAMPLTLGDLREHLRELGRERASE